MIKTCKECGSEFNTRVRIDGKIIRCDKRQRCQDCFPHVQGNTRGEIIQPPIHGETIVCYRCSTSFEYNELIPTCLCEQCRQDLGNHVYNQECKYCHKPFKLNKMHKQHDIFDICSACIKRHRSLLI